MLPRDFFEKSGPLAWAGSFPIYFATALAAGLLVCMVATSLALAAGGAEALQPFIFEWRQAVTGGAVWQFVTYLLVNPPGLWAFLQIVLLALFGREVEERLGRAGLARLYVALWLSAPLLHAICGFLGFGGVLVGSSLPNFGVFIAFALLAPRAEIFFGLQAQWIAAGLLVLHTLQSLAARDWAGLCGLWGVCGVAWMVLRWENWPLSTTEAPRPRPSQPRQKPRPAPRRDVHSDIDPILEKISRSGFASLTREERERLARARERLLENERRDH